MNRLLKLCEKISDKKLKEDTEELLKSTKLHHPEFTMKFSIENCPTAPDSRQAHPGGLIEHTLSVVELCEAIGKNLAKNYKIPINFDHLISAAILHDIYKTVEFGAEGGQYVIEEVYLNHLELLVAELYRRKFPKEIIHIVASHFGSGSATPPRTYEALILHHVDTFDSIIAANVGQMKKLQEQILEQIKRQ
ncbi:Dihydroneopterin 2',3'-cyclic phosphate phosphodiesterase [uncultured archaeon]|nr:Dihydroneopterin 2',3'-cyclic phosphate phosphodiesterase [uncultured archaeon]